MHRSTLYCNETCWFMSFPCSETVESSLPVLGKGRNVKLRCEINSQHEETETYTLYQF